MLRIGIVNWKINTNTYFYFHFLDLSDIKQCYFDSLHPDTPDRMNEVYHKLCDEEKLRKLYLPGPA